MVTTPNNFPLIHVFGDSFQDNLLYQLPKDQGEANHAVVSQILLALLEGSLLVLGNLSQSPQSYQDLAMTSDSSLSTHI